MKTNKKHILSIAIAAAIAVSCDQVDPVSLSRGNLPDETAMVTSTVTLRSSKTSRTTIPVIITTGEGHVTEGLLAAMPNPSRLEQTIMVSAEPSLVEVYNAKHKTDFQEFPAPFFSFGDESTLKIPTGKTSSDIIRLNLCSKNALGNKLEPGKYLLPISAAVSGASMGKNTLYYEITVREPFKGVAELTEAPAFFVFYLNTTQYDPRLVTDYYLMGSSKDDWYKAIGSIVNLRRSTVAYDTATGRALLKLAPDLRYVLDHWTTRVRPVQESGRKVCLCIEGGGQGIGFCNMTDSQIEDFVEQVRLLMSQYSFDGINLWDRNSGYGKEGMPPMNTTSYPKLIKALRELLGKDKLLTLTDYEEPTEYFWDTAATGGIKVGEYLDYAWSGYCDEKEAYQIVDPYHQGEAGVSTLHPRKPISGLDSERYGCLNVPWRRQTVQDEAEFLAWEEAFINGRKWYNANLNGNNIVVYEDIRTSLQDAYETSWDFMFIEIMSLISDSAYYQLDKTQLSNWGTHLGYGKWLKDW